MKQLLRTVAVLLCALGAALADAGILVPRDKSQPDSAILSLDDMLISVRIDNGAARVYVRQIFGNYTSRIEEGNYIFALPSRATTSTAATRYALPARLLAACSGGIAFHPTALRRSL
jgi:hypothetical protein